MEPIFKEEQKFTQGWLWIILIGIVILPIMIPDNEFENTPTSDPGIIISFVIIFMVIAFFLLTRLKTEIDKNEIRKNFFPFVKRRVPWSEIKSVEIVNYGFVGGWGIRLWTPYGIVYNVKGNKGLAIELLNGTKFLIGTQKEEELNQTLEELRKVF